jgi:hypothetical protein
MKGIFRLPRAVRGKDQDTCSAALRPYLNSVGELSA